MKCEISLPKIQIQDYPPPPLLISEGIFCAYVWYAHERLIIRWNKDALICQSTAVFFKDKRLLQPVVFPGKLRPVTFLWRLHLHKCSNYVPRLFPHPNPQSLNAASFFFFSFQIISARIIFLLCQLQSHHCLLREAASRIPTRLAGRLADNIAINQRVVALYKRALTGPHQGFLRLIMSSFPFCRNAEIKWICLLLIKYIQVCNCWCNHLKRRAIPLQKDWHLVGLPSEISSHALRIW